MSVLDEQMKGLSPEEQQVTHRLVEVSQALYGAAEAQLLEALSQTEGRLRDGFEALVMVCSVARAIQSLTFGRAQLGPASEKDGALLIASILTIGGVMGNGLIPVSTDFPFSAEEMVVATSQHINAGADAFFSAVAEAIERLGPVMIELALYFASVYGEEYAAFARWAMDDVGPID